MPLPLSKVRRVGDYGGRWWLCLRCRCCCHIGEIPAQVFIARCGGPRSTGDGGREGFVPPVSGQALRMQRQERRIDGGIEQMSPHTAQWKCRICGFDRWHNVSVRRKNGAIYNTSFYACSGCSVMFLNPAQFNTFSDAAPNIEMPNVVRLSARR